MFVTYGLSEAGPRVATLLPSDFQRRPESVGRPLPGVEAKVVDAEGRPRAAGEEGELVLRTPSVMSGYFGDEGQTAAVLRDGWLLTGDVVRMDEDGFIFIVGRKSREFKINGKKVPPRPIEESGSSSIPSSSRASS